MENVVRKMQRATASKTSRTRKMEAAKAMWTAMVASSKLKTLIIAKKLMMHAVVNASLDWDAKDVYKARP